MFGKIVAVAELRRREVLTPELLGRIMNAKPIGPVGMIGHTLGIACAIAWVWVRNTWLAAKAISKATLDLVFSILFAPLVGAYLAFDMTTVLIWIWWKIVSKESSK